MPVGLAEAAAGRRGLRRSRVSLWETGLGRAHGAQLVQVVAVPVDPEIAGVPPLEVGAGRQEGEDLVEPDDRPLGRPEGVVDPGDELEVFRVVDRPALALRQVAAGLPGDVAEPEALRALPDEG